jgi:hypothetical protein
MAGGFTAPDSDGYYAITRELQGLQRRLAELEAPTGTSINSLVQQVQQAIANIVTTVNAAIEENSYTKSQIDSRIADKVESPGDIAPVNVTATGDVSGVALTATGDVTAGGAVAATGNVTGASGTFPAGLSSEDAYGRLVTGGGSYRAAWVHESGFFGYAPSSREFKTNIAPARFSIEDVLKLSASTFSYYAAVPYGQEYQPEILGAIVEDVDAAGFPWLVDRDADGNPFGLNHSIGWLVVLEGMRDLYSRTIGTEGGNA